MTNTPTDKASNQISYRQLINQATEILYQSSDSPRIDAEVLMQHATQNSMAWLIAYGDTLANASHIEAFFDLIEQRRHGRPIAYIVGYKEFWSLRLFVDESVLIPRGDTETLVEQCLARLANNKTHHVLDLGTGSGAIALAIAKERPESKVDAVDSSSAALLLAERNASANELHNLRFMLSSWYDDLAPFKYDLIASNPPYVAQNDAHLDQGDLRFEPSGALIADADGIGDILHIISKAPSYLKNNGWLLIEHGYEQQHQVAEIFSHYGFSNIELFKDLNQLPRCTAAQLSRN